MTSTAIAAARLLREYAEELKRSHTIFSSGAWPEGESEAKAAYEQHIAIASALEAMPAKCLHQIQEPTPVTAMDALREAEAALEVAMARILKADPGHSICVTSEAKALVAVRAALAAPAPVLVAQPQLHAALFAARGALQHMKEGGKPTQSLLNEAIAAIDSVAVTQAAPAAVAVPENVREGAPYDNPAFEKLARELGVWGTAQSAVCAQFWLAATPAVAPTDEPVFLQRLRVEQQELDARQQKLGAFIESSEFRLLSETDAALLSKQEVLQHVLLQTLNQRIHSASEKHMREKRNA